MAANGTTRLMNTSAPAGRFDLVGLQKKQTDSASRLKQKSEQMDKTRTRMAELRSEMQEAAKTHDVDRMQILNADYRAAADETKKSRNDIAGLMGAMMDGYKEINVKIKSAEEFLDEETTLIKDAEETVKVMQRRLSHAENTWYIIPGGKERAITKAKEALATAEEGVKTAQQLAEAGRRDRLNTMNMQQFMQLQLTMAQELSQKAQDQIEEMNQGLTELQTNTDATATQLKEETSTLERLDQELVQANGELHTLREELSSYKDGSSEAVDCQNRIREKTRQRDDTEAERNRTFLLTQQLQVFIEFNTIEEEGHREALSKNIAWIGLLQLGVQQRQILYDKHLRLLNYAADQEAMSISEEAAGETDIRSAQSAAMHVQAMRKGMLDWLDKAPKNLKAMQDIKGAMVEGAVDFEKQLNDRIDAFKRDLGAARGFDDRETYRQTQPAA